MQTLTNGTRPVAQPEKKTLTKLPVSSQAGDICAILDACLKTGVTTLKWRDLEVSFNVLGQPVMAYDLPKTSSDGFAPQASEQELTRDPRISTVDKELLEDMRLSQLMIDDPLSFEQEIMDAHTRSGGPDA